MLEHDDLRRSVGRSDRPGHREREHRGIDAGDCATMDGGHACETMHGRSRSGGFGRSKTREIATLCPAMEIKPIT
jgi:hypothetical protein